MDVVDEVQDDGDDEFFDYQEEEDDPNDPYYNEDEGHVQGRESAAGSTGGPVSSGDLIELDRYGRKKGFATYTTVRLKLLDFLVESLEAYSILDSEPILQQMSDDSGSSSSKPSTSADALKSRNIRKAKALGIYEDDKLDYKGFLANMKSFKDRIRTAGVANHLKKEPLKKCIQAAPLLQTLKNRAKEHEYIGTKDQHKFGKSFYCMPYIKDIMNIRNGSPTDRDRQCPRELLITMVVYQGASPIANYRSHNESNISIGFTIVCLGSSTLAEFVSKIWCPLDEYSNVEDTIEDPDGDATAADLQRERMILIEETFYTDSPNLQKSRTTFYRDWLKDRNITTNEEIFSLDSVQLQDIEIRMGAPYLYKHGVMGCEHQFVFADARMMHPDDDMNVANYPRVIWRKPRRYPRCIMCNDASGWQVTRSTRYPDERNFVCYKCNELFNYKADGTLVEADTLTLVEIVRKPDNQSHQVIDEPDDEIEGESPVNVEETSVAE